MSAAKDMAAAISLWNQSNSHTLLILISQIRNDLGGMYVSQKPTHGHAPKFFSSTVVKLFSSESIKQAKMGKIQIGDYIEEVPIGREVTWTLENSKTSKPFQTGTYDFYFAGDRLGADTLADIIDSAVKYGLIKKSGPGWFELDGVKIQGRTNLLHPPEQAIYIRLVERGHNHREGVRVKCRPINVEQDTLLGLHDLHVDKCLNNVRFVSNIGVLGLIELVARHVLHFDRDVVLLVVNVHEPEDRRIIVDRLNLELPSVMLRNERLDDLVVLGAEQTL